MQRLRPMVEVSVSLTEGRDIESQAKKNMFLILRVFENIFNAANIVVKLTVYIHD
jgi:hypothetical protein